MKPQSMFLPLQVMYNIMHLTLIAIANFRFGQFMFNVVDYYVNKFEKTLDWCVPNSGIDSCCILIRYFNNQTI